MAQKPQKVEVLLSFNHLVLDAQKLEELQHLRSLQDPPTFNDLLDHLHEVDFYAIRRDFVLSKPCFDKLAHFFVGYELQVVVSFALLHAIDHLLAYLSDFHLVIGLVDGSR